MNPQEKEMSLTMSPQLNELMGALSKAQGKIQAASKDKSNPFFKSKYADLSSIWDACRSALAENGLSVIQIPQSNSGAVFLVSILGHSSGQWIKGEIEIPISKKDPQTIGSAITYFRRYMLSALVGVAPNDDDDGEKAQSGYRNNGVYNKAPIPALIPQKLSSKQVEEFKFILDECDEKYQAWFYDYIKKQYKTENIEELPSGIFEKMKEAAAKNMNENHSRQRELVEVK